MNESSGLRMENQPENEPLADDDWIEERRCYQTKALLFRTLALLWILPSLTSIFVIVYLFPQASGVIEALKLIRVEQWLSLLVLLVHPVFIYLAVRHRRTEIPTERVFLVPRGGTDPKKLY